MEPPSGFWASLLSFLKFLPYSCGLLILGFIKARDWNFDSDGAFEGSSHSDCAFGDSDVMKDLKYADTHEWVKVEGDSATDHLGDVVYVELPEVDISVSQGKNFGAVESVKATSDINSPVSGEVVEVNEKLSEEPGLVNASPYDKGWIIKVKLSDSDNGGS
uniref:Glycine cleavage system H protein n=1 Tax=Setaria italica TaxID=4555 RepID=K3YMG1_SETIT